METNARRLPDGIQSFEIIRQEGYLYVDKTDLVWKLAHGSKFNYLSRPRRFGKSILVDTLQCYFEGRRELFEGLKIMQLEKEWTAYPVIHFDMSVAGETAKNVEEFFDYQFSEMEKGLGVKQAPNVGLGVRFMKIMQTMCEAKGQRVVVLIDEYDAPLQHSWHTEEHAGCTAVYREVFSVLKAATKYEKFVFLTGITKFTQISLFSVLNNLANHSFTPDYANICGITLEELKETFMPEIEHLASLNGWDVEGTLQRLKEQYDGYHFSRLNMVDVYNPFSLVSALARGDVQNYWAMSGATSMLPKFVDEMELRIREFDGLYVEKDILETSDVTGGAELFLYQSGYLTIKHYEEGDYILGIPNAEIRKALYDVVLPALTMRKHDDVVTAQMRLRRFLKQGMLAEAMASLKALIADVPYSNKKLECMDMKERYRFIVSSIFYAIGLRVEVERMMAKGRIDLVAWTPRIVYVIELKLTKNGGLAAAERQIQANLYAEPFKAEGREVVALAIELDDQGKGLLEWKRV